MKFFSPEVAFISINLPCNLAWNIVMSGQCYLDMLDELQKRVYRTVIPYLFISFERLVQRRNVASLSLFYRCLLA